MTHRDPLDFPPQRARRYNWLRRLVLGAFLAQTALLPLWHQRRPLDGPPWWGWPFALRLGPLELLDPLQAFALALEVGIDWRWVWTVLPGVLLVVLLGRVFCGWACPYLAVLAVANSARWLFRRLGVPLLDVQLPRRTAQLAMVLVLVATAWTGTQLLPVFHPPAVIGRAMFGWLFYGAAGAGATFVLLALAFDTFVSRGGFCRSLCPAGAAFSLLGSASVIRVKNERARCIDCGACDRVCHLGQSPMTNRLDSGCERCGKCLGVCPTGALTLGWSRPKWGKAP